jgi:biotin-(acetyl-CoA carboxylase) ligase
VLVEMLDNRYDQLKNGGEQFLDLEYRNNLLGVNEKRSFKKEKEIFTGIIRDVDHYGRLIIETPTREQIAFSHGEIEFLF